MTAPAPRPVTDHHWCAYCEECPCCDGGDRRFPRHWRLEIRGEGELHAQCSLCLDHRYVCSAPEQQPIPEQPTGAP